MPGQSKRLHAVSATIAVLAAFALAAATDCLAANVLLVIDGSSPNSEESSRKASFETWGHTVTTIQDSASQSAFDTAIAATDVVYIPCTATDWELTNKCKNAPIGVICEERWLDDDFGFSAGPGSDVGLTQTWVLDDTHPVTSGLPAGYVNIVSSSQPLALMNDPVTAGMTVLSHDPAYAAGKMLGVMEAGAALSDGGNAAARRVRLPWGGDSFSWSALNSNGLLIVQNALNWASEGHGSLLLHLKLDETSGTVAFDSSTHGTDGTYVSTPSLGLSGKRDAAAGFLADSKHDRIAIPESAVDGQNQISVAWWMKTTKTGEQAILSGANASYSAANAFLVFFYNHTTFRPYMDGTNLSLSVDSIADGRWHHYAYTHDRATGSSELFIDGLSAGTLSFPARSGTYQIASNGLVIAEEQDSPGGGFLASQAFEGSLDDFRIYNYILSQAEIVELYGLLGHWKFDEGTGSTTVDASPNANDAAFNTGTPTWISGVRNAGLQFNGSSDAETDDPFDPPATGTLAFWYRFNAVPSGSQRLLGTGGDWEIRTGGGNALYADIAGNGGSDGFQTPSGAVDAGRWHHLVAIYNDQEDTYKMYLDGQEVASGSTSITDQTAATLMFGARTGSSEHFDGALDDVRIYNYELSAIDVAELYGLVGHWKLDELSGSTAIDSSLAANNGIYYGGPTLGQAAPREYGAQITNSSQQMVVEPSPLLNQLGIGGDSFSVALWVRPSEPDSHDRPLLHKGDTAQDRTPNLTLNFGDNRVQFAVSAQGNWNAGATSEKGLPADAWSHLTLVKDGKEYRLYIDSKLDTVRIVDGKSYGNSGAMYLGANPFKSGDPCWFDDLRVYNYALSEEQIAEIHGLVGHWKLDETSGSVAIDSSGMKQHGLYVGSVLLDQNGPAGDLAAVEFDGAGSHIQLPTYANLFANGFSMSLWARPTSTVSWGRFLDMGNGAGLHNLIFVRAHGSSNLIMDIYGDSGGLGEIEAEDAIGNNVWRHYVATVNSDGLGTLYVDGQFRIAQLVGTPGPVSRTMNYIAKSNWSGDGTFAGNMSDVRLYNRALTPEEVDQLYSSGQVAGVRIIKWVEAR